jgi:hypothetical protein
LRGRAGADTATQTVLSDCCMQYSADSALRWGSCGCCYARHVPLLLVQFVVYCHV